MAEVGPGRSRRRECALTKPFFILGAPRSGTSLLSRMLDSHPAIAVPDETKIFDTFLPLLPAYGDLREAPRLRRLVQDILGWRWIRRLPAPPHADAVLARVVRPDLGAVFAAVLECWATGQGKTRWGEKTPSNLYFWPRIASWFPNATIVHILRDGRDVAISQIKAPFGPKTVPAAARRWIYFVAGVRALREQVAPDSYVEIRYEDLLAHPRETMAIRARHHRRAIPSGRAGVPPAPTPGGHGRGQRPQHPAAASGGQHRQMGRCPQHEAS